MSNTKKEINFQVELTNFKTVSDKVRYLASQGINRSEISKMLNIRYQHVRNILTRQLKKK